jgi:hypothetical protein
MHTRLKDISKKIAIAIINDTKLQVIPKVMIDGVYKILLMHINFNSSLNSISWRVAEKVTGLCLGRDCFVESDIRVMRRAKAAIIRSIKETLCSHKLDILL